METISGIGYYDSLNKLVVGFLLCALPWVFCDKTAILLGQILPSGAMTYTSFYKFLGIGLFVVWSYIMGVLWHHLIIEKCAFLNRHRNNKVSINKVYQEVYGNEKKEYNLKDYYQKYYNAENSKLLGSVHVLESLEAFMRSTLFIIPIYGICTIMKLVTWNDVQNCVLLVVMLLVILCLVVMGWWSVHNKIEIEIYRLVIEADCYNIQRTDNNGNNGDK